MGPALLPMFKPDIRTYAKRALEDRQVEVRLGEAVAAIEPTRAQLKSGTLLDARTVVWCAGLHANPVVQTLGVPLEHGRVPTEPDLSLASHPDAFAVGDIAWTIDTNTNQALPQLAAVAQQAGHHAGHNIARVVAGEQTEPFHYQDKATMATIGRGAGVVQTHRGHTFTGRAASLAWGAVHLALLSTGGEDRVKAAIDWAWADFTHERAARISLQEIEPTDD
jgi:NADH:ubiquinone reductase (H+-translocating)